MREWREVRGGGWWDCHYDSELFHGLKSHCQPWRVSLAGRFESRPSHIPSHYCLPVLISSLASLVVGVVNRGRANPDTGWSNRMQPAQKHDEVRSPPLRKKVPAPRLVQTLCRNRFGPDQISPISKWNNLSTGIPEGEYVPQIGSREGCRVAKSEVLYGWVHLGKQRSNSVPTDWFR